MALKVLVTVPNTGWIHRDVAACLLDLRCESRAECSLEMPLAKPYVNNLHKIVRTVLDDGFDFLVSFDADNPPRRNPVDLVFLDKDVIGCPTPIWCDDGFLERPYFWSTFTETATGVFEPYKGPFDGLQQVDAVGTGCIVVARRVFEAVRAPFMREWSPDGIAIVGNDMAFCRRARAAGFTIWSHFGYPCRHYCEIDLTSPVHAVAKKIQCLSP